MYKLLTCLCLILGIVIAQDQPFENMQGVVDPLENKLIEQQQLKAEKQLQEKYSQDLNSWVIKELEAFDEEQQILTREAFAFQLDREHQFRWNPSKQGNFKLMIEIFDEDQGDIYLPKNPDQHQYITIELKPEGSKVFKEIGTVYIKKIFNISFYRDFQTIKIRNNYSRKLLVQIGLQDSAFVPTEGIKDDFLKLSNQKMTAIMAQLKQTQIRREKLYKSQWSFKDREQRHQSQMLVLTGVELVVILATAIIQMYCIKNLLENRSIV